MLPRQRWCGNSPGNGRRSRPRPRERSSGRGRGFMLVFPAFSLLPFPLLRPGLAVLLLVMPRGRGMLMPRGRGIAAGAAAVAAGPRPGGPNRRHGVHPARGEAARNCRGKSCTILETAKHLNQHARTAARKISCNIRAALALGFCRHLRRSSAAVRAYPRYERDRSRMQQQWNHKRQPTLALLGCLPANWTGNVDLPWVITVSLNLTFLPGLSLGSPGVPRTTVRESASRENFWSSTEVNLAVSFRRGKFLR